MEVAENAHCVTSLDTGAGGIGHAGGQSSDESAEENPPVHQMVAADGPEPVCRLSFLDGLP
ncbi:hypothetical protein SZ55_2281 [Pseudomonas sp. FeS53a]|nr:hypothetical protein SZ55_2281 [Pseudomonas sp. FeS53a]